MRIATLILIAACSAEAPTIQPLMVAVSQPGDCIDPRTLGAAPDDGRDDREAIQAAIDQGTGTRRPVCIGPGVYEVSRAPNRIASLLVAGDGALVVGAGPSQTSLVMVGAWPGDWRLFEVTGSNHRIADLGLDGSARGLTPKDQIHLVQVTGPAQSIVLADLRLNLPVLPDMSGGDCIRLLGAATALVDGVTIERVTMPACARSGVSFQRGVVNVWIEHVTTALIKGQALDFEPTGDGEVRNVAVRDSSLRTGHGGVGIRARPTTGLLVDGVTIECAAPSTEAAIVLGQIPATATEPATSPARSRVTNSSVTGTCDFGLVTGPGGSLVFANNIVETMTGGVRFTSPPTVTPVITGNVISAPQGTAPTVVAPASTVYAGSNGT